MILFGSLATGAEPHDGTDIDLCVEGLTQADAERAALGLGLGVGPVDIVRWETAPPAMRALIEQYGQQIGDP